MKKIAFLTYPIVAAVSLLAAGAVFADDGTIDNTNAVTKSQKTREQVQQELFQARADGSIKVSSTSYNPLAVAKSLRTREEVRAEAIAAAQAGNDRVWFGEDGGQFAMSYPKVAQPAPVYAKK